MSLLFAAGAGKLATIAGTLNINVAGNNDEGIFNSTNSTTTVTGLLTNNGGIITSTTANLLLGSGGTYRHNDLAGTIPDATWNANSTLEFSNGGNIVPADLPTTNFGKILVTNNTNVTLNGLGGTIDLTVNNGTGDDLIVASGSSLNIGNSIDNFTLSTGTTGNISGTYTNGNALIITNATSLTVSGRLINQSVITGATVTNLVFLWWWFL